MIKKSFWSNFKYLLIAILLVLAYLTFCGFVISSLVNYVFGLNFSIGQGVGLLVLSHFLYPVIKIKG